MTGYGYVSLFVCSSNLYKPSLKDLLFFFLLFSSIERRFLCPDHCRLLTDSKSNVRPVNTERQCDRLHTESVAMLTVNIPVKSDICFQSSPLGSLQQLPWKPQCHFPPLFVPLDILKAFFFFESWFIKAGKTISEQKTKSLFCLVSLCVCVNGCVHGWYIYVHARECPSYDLQSRHRRGAESVLLSEQGCCWGL